MLFRIMQMTSEDANDMVNSSEIKTIKCDSPATITCNNSFVEVDEGVKQPFSDWVCPQL